MIYVDELVKWGPERYRTAYAAQVGARHGHLWCYLFADEADCEELHAFALRLGLVRAYFQGNHYDLVPRKREAAVLLGARELTLGEAIVIWRKQREVRRAG
jgi:hypothetical protein